MNLKEIKDLDFKLLAVFDAVFETQSVTVAGKRIGLSQPAMSYSLTRLRAVFGDPLFIRVGHRMEPTARAEDFSLCACSLVRNVCPAMQAVFSSVDIFAALIPKSFMNSRITT